MTLLDLAGVGALWGIVITSGPYQYILEKLKLEFSPLGCALCSGTWISVGIALMTWTWSPIGIAAVPCTAEFIARWIKS